MVKRIFDIIFSLLGLLLLSPLFIILAILVVLESPGGVFYKQIRVGRGNKDFGLYKFRSMHTGSDKKGLLTVGAKDSRITRTGYILRKYKLDELPQLINVLTGDMSFVGPRPEVRKYVDMYTPEQLKVLDVKPGITDYASIKFRNESELLSKAADPEDYYIKVVMPEKLSYNKEYIENNSFWLDIKLIFMTLYKIVS